MMAHRLGRSARLKLDTPRLGGRGQLAARLLAGLALAVATAGHAIAAPFAITDLGTLGGPYSVATALNDVGQVVGYSASADGTTHAFIWQNGTIIDLGTLSAAGGESYATGINNLGQAVGYSTAVADPSSRAFLWQSGIIVDLNSLIPADSGWTLQVAAGINETGQIVGSGMHNGEPRAFLWHAGTVTDLGTLGGNSSAASAINDVGQVVGSSATADGFTHAFLWQNGTMSDLGALNTAGGDSHADGINNLGQVVGASASDWGDDDGTGWGSHLPIAFLWQNGWMAELHSSLQVMAHVSEAMGINDAGQMVGWASDIISCCRAIIFPGDLNELIPAASGFLILDWANAINNAGQIVGSGSTPAGGRAFLLTPSPFASLSLNPTTVPEQSPSTGTVTLATAAPEGGAAIALSSSNTVIATVPATVIVPAGATSATFTVSTKSASASTPVMISATYARVTVSATLTVTPALAAISLIPTSVTMGTASTGTVTLSAPAPTAGAVVALLSSNAVASVPTSVTVAAGATSATFTVSTGALTGCASSVATISATYGGVTRSAGFTVTPMTDTLTIQQADYFTNKRQLRVSAKSTSSAATLQAYVTSTGALIGTLQNLGDGRYTGQFTWTVNPKSITVRSSLCGSATRAVTLKWGR